MEIVFVSDSFHHHQKGVADALYRLTKGSYCFITTSPLREERKKMGFSGKYPDYVLDASLRSPAVWSKVRQIIDDAEVVVLGSAPYELLQKRLSQNKLTFRYSERLWKDFKHYFKTPFYMLDNYKTRGCRLLCSSGFAAYDYNKMGAFKNSCYKWGYFTKVDKSFDIESQNLDYSRSESISLMWCARFLRLKHPEIPVLLAQRLKQKGYKFHIDMFGSGDKFKNTKTLISKLDVEDYVRLCGNLPNDEILNEMRHHSIFLFTSDRNEGWGAVANESMSNGCVLVAGDEIGSVPYLIKDKYNGCTFKSPSRLCGFTRLGLLIDEESLDSIEGQVEWLINNPNERLFLSNNAVKTMQEEWSPETAAKNLLILINDIKQGRDTSIAFGPCSKA